MTQADTWHRCYEGGWQGLIVPEAFAHPAKFAYKLTERMIGHAIAEGCLKKGSIIVDPFGGIGCGGIVAAYCDIQWIGVELEQKFVDLAEQNFKLHDPKWRKLNCPRPVIIQGDSRQLSQILSEADCIVASPPFCEAQTGGGIARKGYHNESMRKGVFDLVGKRSYMPSNQGQTPGQLATMKPGSIDAVIASPPFQGEHSGVHDTTSLRPPHDSTKNTCQGYGQTPGNLGNLKPGSVDAVVSSPPYARETVHGGNGIEKDKLTGNKPGKHSQALTMDGYGQTPGNLGNLKPGSVDAVVSSPPFQGAHAGLGTDTESRERMKDGRLPKTGMMKQCNYGNSPGNIAALPPGQIDCVLSSPPFQTCQRSQDIEFHNEMQKRFRPKSGGRHPSSNAEYSPSKENLGNSQSKTFWDAARIIVEQCYHILKPGGHAIWVVKDFVRNKKRVDFTGDWRRLCEAVGFETLHVHHAMLTQVDEKDSLFGHKIVKKKERKSFFRRLAESKGSPTIDYEVVLCMRKALFE